MSDIIEQAPWLAAWVGHQLRVGSAPRAVPAHVAVDAMYFYGAAGVEAALTAAGEIWVGEYDLDTFENADRSITWRRAEGTERVGFIVLATRRFPTLEALLPVRTADATACTACRATGDWHVFSADHKESLRIRGVICKTCGGLGWRAALLPS